LAGDKNISQWGPPGEPSKEKSPKLRDTWKKHRKKYWGITTNERQKTHPENSEGIIVKAKGEGVSASNTI